MSCMFVAPSGDCDDPGPLPLGAIDELSRTGLDVMQYLLGAPPEKLKPPAAQFTGAAKRTDGKLFYLSIVAPEFKAGPDAAWSGAFYAPFGHFHVAGSVKGAAAGKEAVTLSVAAKLVLGSKDLVAADWTVLGPKSDLRPPNRSCLIKAIKVTESGPHDKRDIRMCIARHAPERAWGEPKTVVASQCAVAVACLVEAIC